MVFKKEESSEEENNCIGGDEWQCGFHEEF